MPKRTAKQIRLDTLEELRVNGKLDNPEFGLPRTRLKLKVRPKDEPYCCENKYGDNLPERFRRCFDCPKLTSMQKSTS